ncbi:hypothetical protein BS329_15495 [Amycolatopsis coloradensis]|uniref:Uncharacterized protein n=1 Tax=Amycolatopsis coloradensis TaxID=76021 RepID=A0A1R0KU69_9PSEU|nr:tetratricopeptide repeat protein [Amycolatopsis coloradensis]OLZ51668.1 hypothetical protein BS329_15495 [Amycolatopsis coloradensis]
MPAVIASGELATAWLRTHALGITAAHRCGNAEAEARLRCQLGRAYLDLGHFDAAEQACSDARDLARSTGDRLNESVAVDQLGMAAQGLGDLDKAVAYFTESLRIEEELGIDRGVALRHRRIGEVLLQAGRFDDADRHLRVAREMFADMGDREGAAAVEVALARLDAHVGSPAAALQRLQRVRESRSAGYEADVLMALADVARIAGDLDAARNYARQAIQLCEPVGGLRLDRAKAWLASLATADFDRS